MCNIIINSFYLSDKILLNNYIYIIWNIQLTTNVGIHVTPFLKRVNISKSFVHLELVLITWYMMLLNYVWLCNFGESYIKLPNFIHDNFFFSMISRLWLFGRVIVFFPSYWSIEYSLSYIGFITWTGTNINHTRWINAFVF